MTKEEAIKILKSKMDGSVDTSYEWTEAVRMAIEALNLQPTCNQLATNTISRQDALKPFCITPDGTRIPEVDCDNFPVEFSVEFIKKHLLSLPSAEPKTMNKTNANKIYSYLKERIGDTVDDMKEFDAWFERMVWHVKECDRLAKEPKTGKWTKYHGCDCLKCDQCGMPSMNRQNFCCGCGADMRGEEE